MLPPISPNHVMMSHEPRERRMTYDAFLSYTRTPDRFLAEALQRGLHHFAKPVFARRALWVFRDETSLGPDASLPGRLRQALEDSRHLLLLACPESAARPYVDLEVQHWIALRRGRGILLALTGGEIVWDAARRDFDWTKTTALSPAFSGVFDEEPGWIDLRALRAEPRLDRRHPVLASAVAQFAAAITGRKPEELYGEDLAAQRRLSRLRNLAVGGILLLMLGLAIAWNAARLQRDESRARQWAAQAEVLRGEGARSTLEAVALASESLAAKNSFEANLTLRRALGAWYQDWEADVGGRVSALALSADGQRVVAGVAAADPRSPDGTAVVLEASTGRWRQAVRPRAAAGSWGVELSPTATILRTSGMGGDSPQFWDLASGRELRWPSNAIAAFPPIPSRDGTNWTFRTLDGEVVLWDGPSWKPRRVVSLAGDPRALIFSPDGQRLLAGGYNGTVLGWEVATGREVIRVEGQGDPQVLQIDATGRRLAIGGANGELGLWDAESARVEWRTNLHAGITRLEFHPRLPWLAVGLANATAELWRLDRRERTQRFELPKSIYGLVPVDALQFSRGGTWLVVGGTTTYSVWDAVFGNEIAWLRRLMSSSPPRFLGDTDQVLSIDDSGSAGLWRLGNGRRLADFRHGLGTQSLVANDAGTQILTGGADGTVRSWRPSLGRSTFGTRLGVAPWRMAVSPAGSWIAAGGQDGTCHILSAPDGTRRQSVPLGAPLDALAWDSRGEALASAGSNLVRVIDTRGWTSQVRGLPGMEVSALAFLAGPGGLVVGGQAIRPQVAAGTPAAPASGRLEFLSPTDLTSRHAITLPGVVTAMVASREGRSLVWSSSDGRLSRLTLAIGNDDPQAAIVQELPATFAVRALSLSADGRRLAVGGDTREIVVWSLERGPAVKLGSWLHEADVLSVDLSPSGRFVAGGGREDQARVYEVDSHREVARVDFPDWCLAVRFDPVDERWIYTAAGAEVERHPVAAAELVSLARERLPRVPSPERWKELAGDVPYPGWFAKARQRTPSP